MKLSSCRSCGASIVWTATTNGKKMPVDVDPVPLPHGFRLEDEEEESPRAVFVAAAAAGERLYQSHFSTCPNAAQHRRKP